MDIQEKSQVPQFSASVSRKKRRAHQSMLITDVENRSSCGRPAFVFPDSIIFPQSSLILRVMSLLLQCLPLLRSVALRGPSVDSSNFSLENRVDQTVACKHVLALELRGDNHGLECLTTSAYTPKPRLAPVIGYNWVPKRAKHTRQILNLHMLSLQLLHQLGLE